MQEYAVTVDHLVEIIRWKGTVDSNGHVVEQSHVSGTSPDNRASEFGEPVEGLAGVIVSAPVPKVDDYFQVLNQNGERYGITSLDPHLRTELEKLRDTKQLIRIWSRLFRNRMDTYNTQIEVTRFELYIP